MDDKISALTSYTTPISTDVLAIVDVTGTETKKITIPNLIKTWFSNVDAASFNLDNLGQLISNAADPADTGFIRMGNAEIIAWESSPAGTDGTFTFSAIEEFTFNRELKINTNGGDQGNNVSGLFIQDDDTATIPGITLWKNDNSTSLSSGVFQVFHGTAKNRTSYTNYWASTNGTQGAVEYFVLVSGGGEQRYMDINRTTAKTITLDNAFTLDVDGGNIDNIQNLIHDISTTTTALDFDGDELQTISISANTTFTTSNRAIGKSKTIKISCDSTLRTLTFPAWTFVGSKPADIAANKDAILTLTNFGSTDALITAAYSVEA